MITITSREKQALRSFKPDQIVARSEALLSNSFVCSFNVLYKIGAVGAFQAVSTWLLFYLEEIPGTSFTMLT